MTKLAHGLPPPRSVHHDEQPIAVYHEMSPRRVLPLDEVAPGSYRLIVELTSERSDLPPDVVLPIVPVADTVAVQLR